MAADADKLINCVHINFSPEDTKGEKLPFGFSQIYLDNQSLIRTFAA